MRGRRRFGIASNKRLRVLLLAIVAIVSTGLALGGYADAVGKMRARAQEEWGWIAKERATPCDLMIVEGVPFVEILKIAADLDVDLVAMGMRAGSESIAELLFGGTADRVLRAARCPVLCVP